jgi:hypothetical protein
MKKMFQLLATKDITVVFGEVDRAIVPSGHQRYHKGAGINDIHKGVSINDLQR